MSAEHSVQHGHGQHFRTFSVLQVLKNLMWSLMHLCKLEKSLLCCCRQILTCPGRWWSLPSWTPACPSLLGALMLRCSCGPPAACWSPACSVAAPSSRKHCPSVNPYLQLVILYCSLVYSPMQHTRFSCNHPTSSADNLLCWLVFA